MFVVFLFAWTISDDVRRILAKSSFEAFSFRLSFEFLFVIS